MCEVFLQNFWNKFRQVLALQETWVPKLGIFHWFPLSPTASPGPSPSLCKPADGGKETCSVTNPELNHRWHSSSCLPNMDQTFALVGLNPENTQQSVNYYLWLLCEVCVIPFFFKCHIIFWNDGLLWKLLVIIWEKKIEKKLSSPWMRGEENCPPHWCFGLSEQGELGKDGNNSLFLCLSKLKNESYLYYNFKELEQYQLSSNQLRSFSSHEIWKANLKGLKLKI